MEASRRHPTRSLDIVIERDLGCGGSSSSSSSIELTRLNHGEFDSRQSTDSKQWMWKWNGVAATAAARAAATRPLAASRFLFLSPSSLSLATPLAPYCHWPNKRRARSARQLLLSLPDAIIIVIIISIIIAAGSPTVTKRIRAKQKPNKKRGRQLNFTAIQYFREQQCRGKGEREPVAWRAARHLAGAPRTSPPESHLPLLPQRWWQ